MSRISILLLALAPVTAFAQSGTPQGLMRGYEVEMDGIRVCSDPEVRGHDILCGTDTIGMEIVDPEMNGRLSGYTVRDEAGREICQDPIIWSRVADENSFIGC